MALENVSPGLLAAPEPPPTGLSSYEQAMREGDGQLAERIALAHIEEGFTVADLYEKMIAPAMANIGQLWAEGQMSIADEHLASALNLKVMSSVFGASLSVASVQRRGRVMLVGVEGDRHGVGLRMGADVLELAGFEVLFLGEDVSADELIAATLELRPDLVTLAVPTVASQAAAESTVRIIARECPTLPLLVGGRGLPDSPAPFAGHAPTVATLRELPERVEEALVDTAPSSAGQYWPEGPELNPKRRRLVDASPEDRLLDVAAEAAEATRAHARIADAFRRLAHEDPLTGVCNRRAFEDRLEDISRSGTRAKLAMIDLDGFKSVNDRYGHAVGDDVLRQVASLIEETTREDSFVARLGGDEFAVIFQSGPSAAEEQTHAIIERLRVQLVDKGVTATAGLAEVTADRRDSLIRADLALYRGKESGGDRLMEATD
jgi:diguanylate cyclase (GGDEF)-like protein